ncbi:MAG: hypothetical protein Q7J30_01510 [Candidatus Azambacteria bacterium]|nr:hypothetical protein [Candidatus Azambacteria bacterium]
MKPYRRNNKEKSIHCSIDIAFLMMALFLGFSSFLLLSPNSVSAASVTKSPGTMADDATKGTVAWTNPNNAKASDNAYATVTLNAQTSHYLKATNFGFSIPTGSIIDGIVVESEVRANVGTGQYGILDYIRIVKGGTIGSVNKTSEVYDYDSYESTGSSVDQWGETWTAEDINGSGFGMAISNDSGGSYVTYLDHIRITVYYSDAASYAADVTAANADANDNVIAFNCLPAPGYNFTTPGGMVATETRIPTYYSYPVSYAKKSNGFIPSNTPAYCSDGARRGIYWDGSSIQTLIPAVAVIVAPSSGEWGKDNLDSWADSVNFSRDPETTVKKKFNVGEKVWFGVVNKGYFAANREYNLASIKIESAAGVAYGPSGVGAAVQMGPEMQYNVSALRTFKITLKPQGLDVPFYRYVAIQWGETSAETQVSSDSKLSQLLPIRIDKDGEVVYVIQLDAATYGRKVEALYHLSEWPSFNIKKYIYYYVDDEKLKESVALYDENGLTNTKTFHYTKAGISDYWISHGYGDRYNQNKADHYKMDSQGKEYLWKSTSFHDYPDNFSWSYLPKQEIYYLEGGQKYYEKNIALEYVTLPYNDGLQARTKLKNETSYWFDSEGKVKSKVLFDQFVDPGSSWGAMYKTYRAIKYAVVSGKGGSCLNNADFNVTIDTPWLTQYFVNDVEDETKRVEDKNMPARIGMALNEKEFCLSGKTYEQAVLDLKNAIITPYYNDIKTAGFTEDKYTAAVLKLEKTLRGLHFERWQIAVSRYPNFNKANAWMGEEKNGDKFYGLWLFDKDAGVEQSQTNKAIFFDLTTSERAKKIIDAADWVALRALSKRYDKWDYYGANSGRVDGGGKGILFNNTFTNNLAGGYLPVTEYAKPDLTTQKLLDDYILTNVKAGIDLAGLSDKQIVDSFYSYFVQKPYMQYFYEWAPTVQTLGETLNRGGGNCADTQIVGFNLLHNLFLKLNRNSAAQNVYLANGKVVGVGTENNDSNYHAAVLFIDPSTSKKYYMETGVLMTAASIESPSDGVVELNSSWSGFVKAASWTITLDSYTGPSGVLKKLVDFTLEGSGTVSVGENRGAKIAQTHKLYLDPIDSGVEEMANYVLALMQKDLPQNTKWTDMPIDKVLGYANAVFSKIIISKADVGFDSWAPSVQTIANADAVSGKISGDCEDLSFAEASLLQNIYFKYVFLNKKDASKPIEDSVNEGYLKAAKLDGFAKIAVVAEGDENHMRVAYVDDPTLGDDAYMIIFDYRDGSFYRSILKDYVKANNVVFIANYLMTRPYQTVNWSDWELGSTVEISPVDTTWTEVTMGGENINGSTFLDAGKLYSTDWLTTTPPDGATGYVVNGTLASEAAGGLLMDDFMYISFGTYDDVVAEGLLSGTYVAGFGTQDGVLDAAEGGFIFMGQGAAILDIGAPTFIGIDEIAYSNLPGLFDPTYATVMALQTVRMPIPEITEYYGESTINSYKEEIDKKDIALFEQGIPRSGVSAEEIALNFGEAMAYKDLELLRDYYDIGVLDDYNKMVSDFFNNSTEKYNAGEIMPSDYRVLPLTGNSWFVQDIDGPYIVTYTWPPVNIGGAFSLAIPLDTSFCAQFPDICFGDEEPSLIDIVHKTIAVTKSGAGSGTITSNPAGINCGSTCSHSFASDTPVTLTSSPASGSIFDGWSGDCSGAGACVLTMDTDKTVNATFSLAPVTPLPGDFSLSLGGGGSATCNSVPLSWTASSDATAYRILKGSPRVDISPYQPYTALNYNDTSVVQNTDYVYQIEAYNSAGTKRSNPPLNVTTPYCAPTIDTFSANPSSIYQGQTSTLTWTSANTTSCSASGAWSGPKSTNNSIGELVFPSSVPTTTYTLTCSGPGGSAVKSATVDVAPLGLPGWKEIIPR